MAFGPIIGGGAGGGGGGSSLITLTGSTGSIDPTDATDLELALPSGTSYAVIGARITRTAGTSERVKLAAFETADRDTAARWIFGSTFSGQDIPNSGADPLDGPRASSGGSDSFPVITVSSDGTAHLTLTNDSGTEAGAFDVELVILPYDWS